MTLCVEMVRIVFRLSMDLTFKLKVWITHDKSCNRCVS